MKTIDKKMLIGELIAQYPQAAELLVEKYHFHCVGCMAAHEETLEEGAMVHGMTAKEIKSLIADLEQTLLGAKSKKK